MLSVLVSTWQLAENNSTDKSHTKTKRTKEFPNLKISSDVQVMGCVYVNEYLCCFVEYI